MPQINYDTYVDETREMMASAADDEATSALNEELNAQDPSALTQPGINATIKTIVGLYGWTKKLPENLGAGTFRAVLNSVESIDDMSIAFGPGAQLNEVITAIKKQTPGIDEASFDAPPLRTLFPGVFESAHELASAVEADNTLADSITQGVFQFAVPFTGYLKAFGGIKHGSTLMKLGKLGAAEGLTAATSFEAHEGRMADLFEMGRQMDNKFGEVLGQVSPDGSLVNNYVNWMTDRENEGEWEGRFKNAVDSIVTTAGLAPFLKGAAVALREARHGFPHASFEMMAPGSRKAQRGSVGVVPEPVRITPMERKFLDEIWANKADRLELLDAVPGLKYENGKLIVPKDKIDALADYVTETVILERGQGNTKLPPSFYKETFAQRFAAPEEPVDLTQFDFNASSELTDIERARALKNTIVEEVDGEHIVLEGDTLNTNAEIVPIKPKD